MRVEHERPKRGRRRQPPAAYIGNAQLGAAINDTREWHKRCLLLKRLPGGSQFFAFPVLLKP